MKCPACNANMKPFKDGDFELDACSDGCGGVWFDNKELLKFDEKHEFSSSPILELAKAKEAVKVDHNRVKSCPRCPGENLVRQFLDVKNEVEMDQCWHCGGVWLDLGEINAVRAQYETFEDRQKAVNDYVSSMIVDTKETLKSKTAEQIAAYEAELATPWKRATFALKRLLGLDNNPNDGL